MHADSLQAEPGSLGAEGKGLSSEADSDASIPVLALDQPRLIVRSGPAPEL